MPIKRIITENIFFICVAFCLNLNRRLKKNKLYFKKFYFYQATLTSAYILLVLDYFPQELILSSSLIVLKNEVDFQSSPLGNLISFLFLFGMRKYGDAKLTVKFDQVVDSIERKIQPPTKRPT